MPRVRRIDVFCRIVDNFGDAGVAFRLARQLADEHGLDVTLFIDDPAPLARIAPRSDPAHRGQSATRVRVVRIADADLGTHAMPDAIVDAFGDAVPDAYLDRAERAPRPPLWIVLEYLTAEAWVDELHGLPSPPAKRTLPRWFFFPGFTERSGGLLRERDLLAQREAFVRNATVRGQPWVDIGIAPPQDDALLVSLFCYPNRALPALFRAWAAHVRPVACIVPEGVAGEALAATFDGWEARRGDSRRRGALTVSIAPFVDQAAFDRRLQACDIAFVRGEDSFVRAQWAAVPFVWHAYPQDERAHVAKLDAFLARYVASAHADDAAAIRALWQAFNDEDAAAVVPAWQRYVDRLSSLRSHACAWPSRLATQPDLASRLVRFIQNRL